MNKHLKRLSTNLKSFPLNQFNVRDLYGNEDEWFKIPAVERTQLGIDFRNRIKNNNGFVKAGNEKKVRVRIRKLEDQMIQFMEMMFL